MRPQNNVWAFDEGPEELIYESVAWDLPGIRKRRAIPRRQAHPASQAKKTTN